MGEPSELSLREIHAYFLQNNYKVTNTQLVKYFRKYLTGPSISKKIESSTKNKHSAIIRATGSWNCAAKAFQ